MTEFVGKVNSIVFENNQDLFKILDVEIENTLEGYPRAEIKVTGNFGDIKLSGSYRFSGNLIMHDKFGLQFKAESYQQFLPNEEGGLERYLSSDKFPGIGKKAAQKIISELGVDALKILKNNPAKISELPLNAKQRDSLLSGINKIDSFSETILKLTQLGLRKKVANRLYQLYQGSTLEKIKKDPYLPISLVSGYGFKTADIIGKDYGIENTDVRRISGAIFQVLLNTLTNDGDTYVSLSVLLLEASKLLGINQYDPIAEAINELQVAGKVIVDDDVAILANIYQSEYRIAQKLKQLVERQDEASEYTIAEINREIDWAEDQLDIKYDKTQRQAIINAVNYPISILTGGPGTGKTTIINGIILVLRRLAQIPASALYSEDPPFLLAAPTGRAAKRMGEITGITAKTIHRLLGMGIGDPKIADLNELNGELLIVDEMSMVDMFLFEQLLSAINLTSHIVFVGDKDQLPSVGAGNVFADLIKSKAFPTTILTQIHRQGDDSTIITLAHDINEGNSDERIFNKTKNYSFIPCQTAQVSEAVGQIVNLALKKGFEKDDIQVLAAMYHGNGGITKLNDVVQDIMNPISGKQKKLIAHEEEFRIGDRILQLQNNPEKDIYNGQIGKIISIDEKSAKRCMVANFDEREVTFSKNDLTDLTRAYAITIHKSQGSEFPLVILNLTMQNYMMLKRNLLYTAITRAEKNLVLVGDPKAYIAAINTPGNDRKTGLTDKIRVALELEKNPDSDEQSKNEDSIEAKKLDDSSQEDKDFVLTKEKIYSGAIDPMIGMKGIRLQRQ
ncbi:ATP-dependent RecD-like DNA helicase [Lactobacillus gigeriorum]|uniref:ATP-dependent RecD2 DNA helicase n=1 Tax=Lactobacillus gigeriorum DSM 23908 = CRBIP 24.85 TaxID=1423751 RepID=I7LDA7_9LACO|nr:ATP-dependent RecD-like DNA helicase [Lactobacillus gigeriorum]KRN14716.1 exodeoxyribonuclease V alpha subunit [Lactobacillus gigeriorum DSM 23908 = CRBIP 24.85]CCI87176.1 Exodeoxyribonuclease V alpha subunit [Lactobacillus gigeriorum DSM 23908 = CRBIP 24.85]